MTTSAARESALEVRGAVRRLGARNVLAGVSLDVAAGGLVVLAGVNGAGKSSLLRAIGGRLALEAGTIHIAGLDAGAARRAGRLGVVPQDVALDPHLSVRDNLRLWGTLAGVPGGTIDARITDGLARAGLADRGHARVETLSGGMRRRLNLLAGVLHGPGLLLLDEPTVGLDRESRARVYTLLDALRRDGAGVLLVTHDLDEAATSADRVVVLHEGRVVADEPPAALVAAHCPSGGAIVVVPDDGADVTPLTMDGFSQALDGQWQRPEGATPTDLRALDGRLRAAGVRVREVRWQPPSVSGAVAAVVAWASGGRA
ncbi:MAG: ABC transporter ATP-binding protein [Vicinamibacterales bacterium]